METHEKFAQNKKKVITCASTKIEKIAELYVSTTSDTELFGF
jgi:hypothetical protein